MIDGTKEKEKKKEVSRQEIKRGEGFRALINVPQQRTRVDCLLDNNQWPELLPSYYFSSLSSCSSLQSGAKNNHHQHLIKSRGRDTHPRERTNQQRAKGNKKGSTIFVFRSRRSAFPFFNDDAHHLV